MIIQLFNNIKKTRTQFLIVITPVIIISTLIVIGYTKYREYNDALNNISEKLNILTEYQSDIVARPLWNVNKKMIQKYLNGLHNDPDFVGSVVFDDNLSTFGSSGLLKNNSYDDLNKFIRSVNENKDKHFFLTKIFKQIWRSEDTNSKYLGLYIKNHDIYFTTDIETLKIGTLFIVLSDKYRTQNLINNLSKDFSNIILVTIFYILATMIVYSQTTSKPLKKLYDTIKLIRDGKEDSLVGWYSNNEIGQVILEFNKMLIHQFKLKNELLKTNDNLQKSLLELKRRTEEKMDLELCLQQAQKIESIGTLAGGIAHDFNNIMFPIIGMAELLMEDLPEGSMEYQNAREILNAGIRGSELVKQILAFSRQTEHKMIPVRIQHIIKEVVKLSRSTIPANINISHDIQTDCSLVYADPTQIHQVVMNLITNAYHAVESSNGEIAIRIRETEIDPHENSEDSPPPGRYVLLSVSDNGAGISPEIREKIFDPYFTSKKKGKGTGLGLAVVYGIVKEHNGDIQVYSSPGKGTTFNVFFPAMEQFVEPVSIVRTEKILTGNENILLIDDEEPVLKVVKLMLMRLGYTVTAELNVIKALDIFKSRPDKFDIVISDMTMPHMTGDQLAQEIVAIRPDIPIIICSGFSEKILDERTVFTGVKGILMKPVIKSEMSKMVRKVLDEAKSVVSSAMF